MEATDVRTIEDLCDYIKEHAGTICIREQVDGKWDAYSLLELPPDKLLSHVLRFIREGIVPVRVIEHEEVSDDGAAD